MTKFKGNAWGEYSGSLKFGFYTGQDVEVMGNAYWNGSAYYRYGVGRSSKITLGDDGNLYFSATNTSGAADTQITGTPGAYEARGIITASGNWGINTFSPAAVFDVIIPGVASSVMLLGYGGTDTYIRAGSSGGGLHLGDFITGYINLGEAGAPVVIGGAVNHGQPLTVNKIAGPPGIEWSISDVAKAYIGVAQAAEHWITGSVAGDFNIRTTGGSLLFSTDNGTSWAALINASKAFYAKGGIYSYTGAGGYILMAPGDASHSGYMSWHNSATTRLAYMGFDNAELTMVLENGADFIVSGGLTKLNANLEVSTGVGRGILTVGFSNVQTTPVTLVSGLTRGALVIMFAVSDQSSSANEYGVAFRHIGAAGAFTIIAFSGIANFAIDYVGGEIRFYRTSGVGGAYGSALIIGY
jgi:hypothetical protein